MKMMDAESTAKALEAVSDDQLVKLRSEALADSKESAILIAVESELAKCGVRSKTFKRNKL